MVRTSSRIELLERAFRPADFEELLAIEQASFASGWSREAFVGFVRREDKILRVVTDFERPEVPLAFFYALRLGNDELYLANLAVTPARRRQGIGTFALDCVDRIARELGCSSIVLHVQEENLAAQLLYRDMGYRAVDILPDFYGDQEGYRMVKVPGVGRALRATLPQA